MAISISQSVVLPRIAKITIAATDLRRLAKAAGTVDQEIAEAFGRAHELGRDDEHPTSG